MPPKGVPHRKSVYVFYASTLDREGTIGTFGPLRRRHLWRDRWGHPIETVPQVPTVGSQLSMILRDCMIVIQYRKKRGAGGTLSIRGTP